MRVFLVAYSLFFTSLLTGQSLSRFEFSHPQMGTMFRIVLYASDSIAAHSSAALAIHELDRLNGLLSDYDPDSEVSTIAGGKWVDVSADLFYLLEESSDISALSGRAFEITCGNLTKCWRRAIRRQTVPDASEIDNLLHTCGVAYDLRRNPRLQASFDQEHIALDLGGIAKGYALDRMADVLRTAGVTSFMIDGGGDLILAQAPPDRNGWRVQLPDGSVRNMTHCAVATSGPDFKYIQDKSVRYSHIIDPRTGWGIKTPRGVTVIGQEAALCDAWATAITVIGDAEFAQLSAKGVFSHFEIVFYQNQ